MTNKRKEIAVVRTRENLIEALISGPSKRPAWQRYLAAPIWLLLHRCCLIVPLEWWIRGSDDKGRVIFGEDRRGKLWIWLHAQAYRWFEIKEGLQ